jgi:hypothetical protein
VLKLETVIFLLTDKQYPVQVNLKVKRSITDFYFTDLMLALPNKMSFRFNEDCMLQILVRNLVIPKKYQTRKSLFKLRNRKLKRMFF